MLCPFLLAPHNVAESNVRRHRRAAVCVGHCVIVAVLIHCVVIVRWGYRVLLCHRCPSLEYRRIARETIAVIHNADNGVVVSPIGIVVVWWHTTRGINAKLPGIVVNAEQS